MAYREGNHREPGTQAGREAGRVFSSSLLERPDLVELNEIRIFLALCEERHFGRTASRLGLSGSRVSQVIGRMERRLGRRLFYRSSRYVELTAFGDAFRAELSLAYERLVRVIDRARESAAESKETLRLGFFSTLPLMHVVPIVKAFERTHPSRRVEVVSTALDDTFGPLIRGEADLAISWLPPGLDGLIAGPVVNQEERVLAVARDHPLARHGSVSVEDLDDYMMMRFDGVPRELHDVWVPSATPSGRPITHRAFSQASRGNHGRMLDELRYLLAGGQVIHPSVPSLAHIFQDEDIIFLPIRDLPPIRSALFWRRDQQVSPAVIDFVDIAYKLGECSDSGLAAGDRPSGSQGRQPTGAAGLHPPSARVPRRLEQGPGDRVRP